MRNCESQATLRGYWGSHSTEEWGNITVSSFKSQHHVGRDILITGFLVENDRLGNWFHPFFTAHEVKWSKCTATADFYSFTRSLWHSLNDFICFTITFHSVSVRDCGVGSARGLFAYISWLRAGAAATATKMGVVCIPTDEKMKCGITARRDDFAHFEEEFLASSDGNRCFFLFHADGTHTATQNKLLMDFRPSLLPLCPAPYCFCPLHQLSGCNQQSGIEGDACLACFDLKKLKKAHCGLMQVI